MSEQPVQFPPQFDTPENRRDWALLSKEQQMICIRLNHAPSEFLAAREREAREIQARG